MGAGVGGTTVAVGEGDGSASRVIEGTEMQPSDINRSPTTTASARCLICTLTPYGTRKTGQRAFLRTSVLTSPNRMSAIFAGPRVPRTINDASSSLAVWRMA